MLEYLTNLYVISFRILKKEAAKNTFIKLIHSCSVKNNVHEQLY